jgi:hypothetical protein
LNKDRKTEVDYEIVVTRRADAPPGKIDTRVAIELDDPRSKSFSIPVTGEATETVKKPGKNAKSSKP